MATPNSNKLPGKSPAPKNQSVDQDLANRMGRLGAPTPPPKGIVIQHLKLFDAEAQKTAEGIRMVQSQLLVITTEIKNESEEEISNDLLALRRAMFELGSRCTILKQDHGYLRAVATANDKEVKDLLEAANKAMAKVDEAVSEIMEINVNGESGGEAASSSKAASK